LCGPWRFAGIGPECATICPDRSYPQYPRCSVIVPPIYCGRDPGLVAAVSKPPAEWSAYNPLWRQVRARGWSIPPRNGERNGERKSPAHFQRRISADRTGIVCPQPSPPRLPLLVPWYQLARAAYPGRGFNRGSLARRSATWLESTMTDDAQQLPDPATPEWTIALALRRSLRMHLGPRHGAVPAELARAVADSLRGAGWHFEKEPPNPAHSTFGPDLG
jgi:hypothetical protein